MASITTLVSVLEILVYRLSEDELRKMMLVLIQSDPESVARASVEVQSPPWVQQVRDCVVGGGTKVQAIKLHRQLTGSTLKDAKDWVELDSVCALNFFQRDIPQQLVG